MQSLGRLLHRSQSVAGDWRVVWPGGSVHWIAGSFQVFKDEAGKLLSLTGVNIDISGMLELRII